VKVVLITLCSQPLGQSTSTVLRNSAQKIIRTTVGLHSKEFEAILRAAPENLRAPATAELDEREKEPTYSGGLDSIPDSNPIPQTGKGGTSMKNRCVRLSHPLYRVPIRMGFVLARSFRLWHKIEFIGIRVSLIPGLLTCNIGFRGGGSVEPTIHSPFRPTAYKPMGFLLPRRYRSSTGGVRLGFESHGYQKLPDPVATDSDHRPRRDTTCSPTLFISKTIPKSKSTALARNNL